VFSYFAYGLGIKSALPLPELVSAEAGCDVTIHLQKTYYKPEDYVPLEVLDKALYCKITKAEATIFSQNLGVFLVRGGCEIFAIPAPDADQRLIRLYIIGTVMAVLLYQRGLLVLHASVINAAGRAVAILGHSGAGKSSTAAALHMRGHHIIADDVGAINLDKQTPIIFPGFPQIKISPEAATALGYDLESLHLLHEQEARRGYRITQDFLPAPLPLERIYVLSEDSQFDIAPLRSHEAVMELVRHSRPTTLIHSGGAAHLLQCANLAKQLTIYRIKRPRSLSWLPELAQLLEEHISRDLTAV